MNAAVSIVMPLFNKAPFVQRAVDSALAQHYRHFELIIVDDGSTDESVALVERRRRDPRIRIIRQVNAGVGAARNRALSESRGALIAFLDADDEWLPNHLSDLVYLSDHFPSAGIFVSRIAFQRGDNTTVVRTIKNSSPCLIHDYFAIMSRPGVSLVATSCCAVRREAVDQLGGFLEATPYGEDQEYWARVSLSYPLAFHPSVSAIYRVGVPDSAISTKQWNAAEMPVIKTLKRYLALHPGSDRREDILGYMARVVLSQAAEGIGCGDLKGAERLLSDPMLAHCRHRRRLRVLRMAAALPEILARLAIRVHHSSWATPWRKLYSNLICASPVSFSVSTGPTRRLRT